MPDPVARAGRVPLPPRSCNFLIAAAPGASFPAKMESAIASAKQHMTRQIFMSVRARASHANLVAVGWVP